MSKKPVLVLALGNDLLADDAIGLLAARQLEPELNGRADLICSAGHGLALLDYLVGYKHAILIDAIVTGKYPPGTVIELPLEQLRTVGAPSPHYAGIPEMIRVAKRLELPFPAQVDILAVEVADAQTIGGPVTSQVLAAIPTLCELVIRKIATEVS